MCVFHQCVGAADRLLKDNAVVGVDMRNPAQAAQVLRKLLEKPDELMAISKRAQHNALQWGEKENAERLIFYMDEAANRSNHDDR